MKSKFSGIFNRDAPAEPSAVVEQPLAPEPLATPPAPRRGRPPGKRSDPGFAQVTAYVPEELHHNVKLALLQDRKGQEFSELVGDLLRDWLNARG